MDSGGNPPPAETVVAKVEASPGPGAVAPGTQIELSCGTGNANIRYTTDGTAPTESSTLYTGAITIDEDMTIKAIGIKEGLTDSEIAVFEYTVLQKSTISQAHAMAKGAPVWIGGVVNYIDGSNLYIQDITGENDDGIIVRYKSKPASPPAVGQAIEATGIIDEYNGRKQVSADEADVTLGDTGQTFPAPGAVTISSIAAGGDSIQALEYIRVKISGATVTDIATDPQWSTCNVTLSDGTKSLEVYKCPLMDSADNFMVGSTVDVTAVLDPKSATPGQYRLRVASADDFTNIQAPAKTAAPTAVPSGGKVYPESEIAFSCTTKGARIQYQVGGDGNWITGTSYTVPAGAQPDSTITIQARATHDTLPESGVASFTYTVAEKPVVTDPIPDNQFPADAITIKEALALPADTQNVTLAGQLVYRFDQSSAILQDIIEDTTWAIQIFGMPDTYSIGDVVKLTGTRTEFRTVKQLRTITAHEKLAFEAQPMKAMEFEDVAALKAANTSDMASRFVVVKNVVLGTYNGSGNTTVTNNGSINIYKAAAFPQGVAAGDTVDVYAAYIKDSGGWQLRTGTAEENGFPTYLVANDTKPPTITLPATWLEAMVGRSYTIGVDITDNVGVASAAISYTIGETTKANQALTRNGDTGKYEYTIPAAEITAGYTSIAFTITASDAKNNSYTTPTQTITIEDLPQVDAVEPVRGGNTGTVKRPEVSVTFSNAGVNPTVTLTLTPDGGASMPVQAMTVTGNRAAWTPGENLADGRYTASVTITRADGKKLENYSWTFTVGELQYKPYFGQLHSHTSYSDGAGTLDAALSYIQNTAKNNNVQFVAFTDHSNYFDSKSAANPEDALYDMSRATQESRELWAPYKKSVADFNAATAEHGMLALAGFEMTWSGGPGHINTFNTPGIVSRNNTTLNDKTSDAGLKSYYALLSRPEGEGSISQFNHPGKTFGTFSDFSYWDPIIDRRMALLEVGNGEGQIGAGGYYPSYEHYTTALDKGWHVAPTNNQDNHKGKWGDANDARSVIITDDFTEEGLYKAMQARAVYATEDKNLEIIYTVNDALMGSQIDVPDKLHFHAALTDPDGGQPGDKIATVEIVANSGRVVHKVSDVNSHDYTLDTTLSPDYSYYYLRITQADGNIAVTAPVWVGKATVIGISSLECDTSMPVTGEALTFTTTLFNSEVSDATLKSISYDLEGGGNLHASTPGTTIPSMSSYSHQMTYTPTEARDMTVVVTAVIVSSGVEYTFTKSVELSVLDESKLVYVGIDASHYNEYVAGNYKDSMGNFAELAAPYGVRTVELKTSEALITAANNADGKYKMLLFTAPSRRLTEAQSDPRTYSAAELEAVKGFSQAGGTVVLAGWSDNYENYPVITGNPAIKHMAETQNELLEALGASLRISDDATYDDVRSAADGVDPWRLYFSDYNWDHPLLAGVEYDKDHPYDRLYTQVFSHYGGASIYAVDGSGNAASTLPSSVDPVVFAHATTYSKDVDQDGRGGADIPKYPLKDGDDRLLIMATEELDWGGGRTSTVVVSGAAFMSNFEVQASLDNNAEKNYSNYTICENLVERVNPVEITSIADVHRAPEGQRFAIQGIVTSNASGYDKDTAFFDCIYVEDETGGINAFPVSGDYRIGQELRLMGTTSSYQGERQLAVSAVKVLNADPVTVTPKPVTTKQAATGEVLGQLIKVEGVVVDFAEAEGAIQTIYVRDESGVDARVFIDGYITLSKDAELRANLEKGAKITAVGLASYDNTFDGNPNRIRIRDRADVVCRAGTVDIPTGGGTVSIQPGDIKASGGTASVKLTAQKRSLSSAAEKKLTELNADNAISITGNGLDVTIPEGTLAKGTDVNAMLVNPKDSGNVIRVTHDDGTVSYPAFSLVGGGTATYIADRAGKYAVVDNTKSFPDLSGSLWAADDIEFVTSRELFLGTDGGGFAPDTPMTRSMLVTVLARIHNTAGEGYESSFADVPPDAWYAGPVAWASANKIVEGDGSGSGFAPDTPITREQLCTILARYMDFAGITLEKTAGSPDFVDAGAVSPWAADAVALAAETGLISGKPGQRIDPQGQATRAEIATILARFIQAALK